jgi:hypothetical protein
MSRLSPESDSHTTLADPHQRPLPIAGTHAAWGAPASERYEALASTWRPLFARIRASAVDPPHAVA